MSKKLSRRDVLKGMALVGGLAALTLTGVGCAKDRIVPEGHVTGSTRRLMTQVEHPYLIERIPIHGHDYLIMESKEEDMHGNNFSTLEIWPVDSVQRKMDLDSGKTNLIPKEERRYVLEKVRITGCTPNAGQDCYADSLPLMTEDGKTNVHGHNRTTLGIKVPMFPNHGKVDPYKETEKNTPFSLETVTIKGQQYFTPLVNPSNPSFGDNKYLPFYMIPVKGANLITTPMQGKPEGTLFGQITIENVNEVYRGIVKKYATPRQPRSITSGAGVAEPRN